MPHLGCIADDFTGGTDLAANLTRRGYRVVLFLGLPAAGNEAGDSLVDIDAVVIALKVRTAPVDHAVATCLEALDFLRERAHCERFYFKYCSTFDSNPRGNIGPVADALLTALGERLTIFCPAFPEAGRTLYQGHLFVEGVPLHESGMRQHPLTPMTDPDLVRWLGQQSPRAVGLVPWQTIRQGATAVRARLARLDSAGVEAVLTDALDEDDLRVLGEATADLTLITGGSGLALGLETPHPASTDPVGTAMARAHDSPRVVLSGSASNATRAQVAHAKEHCPWVKLDVAALRDDYTTAFAELRHACRDQLGQRPLVVYSVETQADLDHVQGGVGAHEAGELVERAFADLASELYEAGVRSFIVAGGETSGAVAHRLGATTLRVGPRVAPGVPWMSTERDGKTVNLLLKSGNFGAVDIFTTAWELR